jgi:hypothetical protein
MLIECCCRCGFVHRAGDYRAHKPHYHWTTTELVTESFTLHPTICVACCWDTIKWSTFVEQLGTSECSLSAPLPEYFLTYANGLYMAQAAAWPVSLNLLSTNRHTN